MKARFRTSFSLKMEHRFLRSDNVENLDSARSLPSRMEAQQLYRRDLHALRPYRGKEVDSPPRWGLHDPGKRRDAPSPFRSMDNLFAGPWRSNFKPSPDLLKRQHTPAIKMTYFSLKERFGNREGKDISMLTLQSAQKMNRYASVSSSSVFGSSTNTCRAMQRSPGRKWVYEAGIVTHDEQLKDMIKELDDCRKRWESDGDYLQASSVAKQLQALKIFLENRKTKLIIETHAKEREGAEAAYKAELEEKNQLWGERFKVFHNEVIEHAQMLKQQHAMTLQSFRNKMASRMPKKPQLSRELLNERKVQTFLGKQGKYLEAQKVKRHADRKEMKELQSTLAAYHAEVALKEQALRAKQQTEMAILLQRAAQTRDELKQNKERDLACCTQRNKNILRDLEALHKQERSKHESKMQRMVREFRALGGEIRDLTHAMETLVVPTLSDFGDVQESAASMLEVQCLNIG